MIDRLICHWRKFNRIESWYTLIQDAFGVGQRIEYGQLHSRDAHLGQHTAVDELDERVNNTLGMDHHVDTLVGETEKKMRFDHLERFIDQSRAVDADLATHAPGRMSQ